MSPARLIAPEGPTKVQAQAQQKEQGVSAERTHKGQQPAQNAEQNEKGVPAVVSCPSGENLSADMACVPGGWFLQGEKDGRKDEQVPVRTFVQTFLMDRYEVTNQQYEACIDAKKCKRPMRFRRFMGAKQPVVAVSWYDAEAYCELVGKRLPTEAEWERAARGPGQTRYSWGDETNDVCKRANVATGNPRTAEGRGCGKDVTREVGSFPPGHYGLHDMSGNVHEWVFDYYSQCYSGCVHACGAACGGVNPKGPCEGQTPCKGFGLRSVRGGSWYWPLQHARGAARRGSGAPNRGPHRFGFRCAKSL